MNERPTPITDDAFDAYYRSACGSAFLRHKMGQLERERDEIREQYTAMCSRLQECVQEHGIGLGGEKLDKLVCDEIKLLRKDLQEERHAWQNEREDAMADYVAVATENKAMREAIKAADDSLRECREQLDRMTQEGIKERATAALAKLAPFVAE